MSTIGSGVLGVAQGEAPVKGKAGHGKAGEASEKGGFATAIASFGSREGEGGHRNGRLSISGGQHEHGARTKRGDGNAHGVAVVLRKAEAATDEEKPVMTADVAARPGRKVGSEAGHGAETTLPKDEIDPDMPAAEPTEVGNLLDLLATPAVILPHASADGAAAVQDGRNRVQGKAVVKADAPAEKAGTEAADPDAVDGADVPQSDSDKLFRLIRADGKGRELDMRLGDDRISLRDANPTGPKGETVTVVDSRRYIGLAQAGNAAAVTTAIAQDPEWSASLSATGGLTHSEAAATGKVVNTLKIQMNPIELGLVTATLRLHGDELVVSLQVETGEAYRQLTDDHDAIVRALRGHGLAVDQVSVQLAPADRSANAGGDQGQQAQQQQFSSQPQAREGGRGQQGSEGAFAREGGSHEGTMSETASGPAGGQPVRSGGVYL